MATVKVWNDNKYEHVEKFKGAEIRIPAGGCIEMDYFDAIDLKGQFVMPKMLGPNNPDPRYFKMIRVDEPSEAPIKEDPNIFHATGKRASDAKELLSLAREFARSNPDLMLEDKNSEPAGDAEKAEMAAEIERLKAELAGRKKPGPKPKAKVA